MVLEPDDADFLRAMRAAVDVVALLDAVPDDGTAAVGADRRQRMNRTFEAVEDLQRPEINREAHEALARNTGGKLLEIHELAALPPLLKAEHQTRPLRQQQDLWDKWITIVLIALLYCIDVGIRRWTGLA